MKPAMKISSLRFYVTKTHRLVRLRGRHRHRHLRWQLSTALATALAFLLDFLADAKRVFAATVFVFPEGSWRFYALL